jgi:selenocysteine lyase/cysteine desulfurase
LVINIQIANLPKKSTNYMKLNCQKEKFSLPENDIYLNCATMGPLMKTTEIAGIQAINNKSNPKTLSQEAFFESSETLKTACAKLVNAPIDRIALVPSASYGMAIVAKNLATKNNLKSGQHILLVQDEFPSDVYAWDEVCAQKSLRIRTIAPPDNMDNRGKVWNQRLIAAINSETCLVAISPVHWADGTLFDLKAIAHACKLNDALFVIDGTQSVGALPLDIQDIKPDALVCAGYKWLLGPYSCGFAYFGPYFDDGSPLEQNWINRVGSNDFKNLINYQSNYRSGAWRYNMGEQSNFILNPMLTDSITNLMAWGIDNIQEYCKNLVAEPIQKLKNMGYWVENEQYRANHLFGIRLPENLDLTSIQNNLLERNIHVSFRGSAIRISPHLYNNENDLAALVEVLTF